MVTMETEKMATQEMAVNEPLVKVVSIVDTLKAIPAGKSVLYTCQALGNYMTVYSSVRRMNERLGRAQWFGRVMTTERRSLSPTLAMVMANR